VGTKVPPLDEIKDNEDVFLVLPSYAEPFSQKIRQIIFAEKQKCALGFHLSALGGLCCDHGNKLIWGNYSSRTGTFFCIQVIFQKCQSYILGINEKIFHKQKPSEKDIPRGFISPQSEASLSEFTLRNLSSPTLFLKRTSTNYAGVL